MKRLIFLIVSLVFIQQARAQLQPNFAPNACMFPMQPASGAYEREDEEDRIKRKAADQKKLVNRKKKKMAELQKEIDKHRSAIDARLQPEISTLVVRHIEVQGNRADHMKMCATDSAVDPSVGNTSSDVPVKDNGLDLCS